MADIRKLMDDLAAGEARLQDREFVAPCVPGGQIRVRIAGLVCTFRPRPSDFEGWGIFKALDPRRADLMEAASLQEIEAYLQRLPALRVRIVQPLQSRTWLAWPVNESDMRQRVKVVRPVPVHLVEDAGRFEVVMARFDGAAFWHETVDRRADPRDAERLEEGLNHDAAPTFKGMTPEMRTAWDLAHQQTAAGRELLRRRLEERRLRGALEIGGGSLQSYHDRGDHWVVEWTARNGEPQTSLISKDDLTVVSAGICLAGQDRSFDLQSLVNVVEGAGD